MVFSGVSVIMPTIRETTTFVTAVELLLKLVDVEDLHEFLVVVCEKTNKESFKYIDIGRELSERAGVPFTVLYQKRPFFGGAIQDAFDAATGSHVVVETPDLNTSPETLPEMIRMAREHPGAVISCSRWLPGGGFVNYNKAKKLWNGASQKFLDLLYFSKISDFTYGVHLGPTILFQALNYRELKHPFNLEQIVIPLRLGVKVYEIPAVMRTLEDDVTVNPLPANVAYLRPAFRWRFAKRENLVKPGVDLQTLMKQLNG